MTDKIIRVQSLEVTAGQRTILSIEHLLADRGEAMGVLGPNGAGKSTFLKTLVGFQHFSRGEVEVLGRSVGRLGSGDLCRLRRRIGYVPQMLLTHGEMPLTLREVVSIGRSGIAGLGRRLSRRDRQIVDEWTEQLGLSHLADQRFVDCSGGEQRKALIAKAMVQQPELLLLDEPTANLDLNWREQVVAAMQQVYEQTHVTIVLVCHELEVIPPCCGRVVLLEAGRVTAMGRSDEVLSAGRLSGLYGAELNVVHAGGRHAVVPAGLGERP